MIIRLFVLLIISEINLLSVQSNTQLKDNKPATFFEETYVAGNGKTGATFFGKPDREIIFLNDATLWSGEPVDRNINPDAFKNIALIR